MSVPFSNTHLRVPRGFGTILEGLAREVLRDQPEDIPKYAAHYFESLLKQREESGTDPAEWAAKLEDRFYNNHAFSAAGTSPEKETTSEMTLSKEKSYESHTEDESSHSAEDANLSTTQPNVPEKTNLSESTDEEEKLNSLITEKNTIPVETGLSEGESINRFQIADIQSDEPNGTDEEKDPTVNTLDEVDRAVNETDSSSVPDHNALQSDLEPADLSSRGLSNIDVCAQELGVAEDEQSEKQKVAMVDKENVGSEEEEENTDVTEPVDIFPGPVDVDVCATELGGRERTKEGPIVEEDTHVAEEEESLKRQPEETVVGSSLSQSEITEGNKQEAEAKFEEGTEAEASSGETDESLAHTEGGSDGGLVLPKEDPLVEISFEDVPEAQQITEAVEKQPEEEGSIEVLQSKILEIQQEDSKELTASAATDQNTSDTQDHGKPEMERAEKEVTSDGEEIESQHKAAEERVDANNSNINDSNDDENEKGVKNISLSGQPATEAEKENQEDQTDRENEGNEKISEGTFHQNEDGEKETQSDDPDFKENETSHTVKGDEEEVYREGYSEMADQELNDGGAENNSSQVTQSNTSVAGMEAESETFEESAQHVPEVNEEGQRRPAESQPEDAVEEKEAISKEAEELTEGVIDSEAQEKSDTMVEEEPISLAHSAHSDHEAEERPVESEDTTELEGKSSDKEECSRPQEEEDIMDIPLDDPEANRAAAKIQAGFRGHMTRKKMKPEDKAEGEEVSSTGDVLNGSQGDSETGRSGAVERDDTSVPEQ